MRFNWFQQACLYWTGMPLPVRLFITCMIALPVAWLAFRLVKRVCRRVTAAILAAITTFALSSIPLNLIAIEVAGRLHDLIPVGVNL